MNLYVFTPGILHDPGWPDGWTDRAVTWIHTHRLGWGEKFEPAKQWPLLRWWHARQRARDLAAKIREYRYNPAFKNLPIVLTGHSNGAVTATDALKEPAISIDVLNLVAPACDADFERNQLNLALLQGRVQRVNVWIATEDTPLVMARISKALFGWMGLGFGTLGLEGPKNVRPEVAARVQVFRKAGWHHGSFWTTEHFDDFLRDVVAQSGPPPSPMDGRIA